MSNKVIFVELGYYHPSNANWNYRIWLVIDETGAKMYRETFGGDSRCRQSLADQGIESEVLYAGKGSGVEYRWRDVKDLLDIEDYQGKNW